MKWMNHLIVVLALFVVAMVVFPFFIYVPNSQYLSSCWKNFQAVEDSCDAYARAHDGRFPDGKSSNEALRQLFVAGYMADEKFFSDSDYPNSRSDGNIGTQANGFLQALAPGECFMTYVRGLTRDQKDPQTPLFFGQVVSFDGEIYTLCARVHESVSHHSTADGAVLEEHDGKLVDIFSDAYLKEKYGIQPQDILKPEGPPRDLTAIAKARKRHLHAIEAGILALIWLPFPLTVWIKHRRAARTPAVV